MKNTFASILIVIVLALVVSLAVPAAAHFVKPNKSATQTRADQLIGVNITPINVTPGGTLAATGYVQGYCNSGTPPGWHPAVGAEVHFDNVTDDGWFIQARGTTDSNGYFSLACQAPSNPGYYEYGILVPTKGIEGGASLGNIYVKVYSPSGWT